MDFKLSFTIFALALSLGLANNLLHQSSSFCVSFLDVGQGDATLITTPQQHHILIDGGPGNSILTELTKELPFLFRDIDLLILSHPHRDHIEGLIPVLDRLPVNAIYTPLPDYDSQIYAAFKARLKGKALYTPETDFQLGKLQVDTLFAATNDPNLNNISPVIKFTYEDFSFLTTGDAELEIEEKLHKLNLKAELLKAGHHGSRTSNSEAFLKQVQPQIMVISSGEGNQFGHPHPETLNIAKKLNIEVHRTDQEGTIEICAQ